MIEVEVTNAVPYPGRGPKRQFRYPWRTLQIGESFFCHNPVTARSNCTHFGRLLGRKFVSAAEQQKIGGVVVNGSRVWRMPMEGEGEIVEGMQRAEGKGGRYPWVSLAVGESFYCANRKTGEIGCIKHGARLRREFKFEMERRMTADGKLVLGGRVTRTS